MFYTSIQGKTFPDITTKAAAGIKAKIIFLAILAIHLFATTPDTIEDNRHLVKSGFLFYNAIDIYSIETISETNNPLTTMITSTKQPTFKNARR